MKLSILILTVTDRAEFLNRILSILNPQKSDDVEIITISDDGSKSIGQKRNEAIQQSSGEYICFVDDDDIVSSDYVSKILDALKTNPDCVGIHLLHFNDGNLAGFTYHSLKYNKWFEERDMTTGLMRYYRNPNHLNPVKRELALQTPFPEVDWGEDRDYSQRILKLLNTEEYVTEPIYYYMFRSKK